MRRTRRRPTDLPPWRARAGSVLGIGLGAPVTAEFLQAYLSSTGDALAVLGAWLFLAPLYGGAALLIREVAVRTGRGWTGTLLLAAAFGLAMPGLVDLSLFAEHRADVAYWEQLRGPTLIEPLGISAYTAFSWTVGHVVLSIGAPLAVHRAVAPAVRGRPLLGRWGITVTVVLWALVAALIHLDGRHMYGHGASAAQAVGVLLVVAALAAAGMSALGRAPRPPAAAPGDSAPADPAPADLFPSWSAVNKGTSHNAAPLAVDSAPVARFPMGAGANNKGTPRDPAPAVPDSVPTTRTDAASPASGSAGQGRTPRGRGAGRPVAVGAVFGCGIAAKVAFDLIPPTWPGLALAVGLVAASVAALRVVPARRRWRDRETGVLGAALILGGALVGVLAPPPAGVGWPAKLAQNVILVALAVLLTWIVVRRPAEGGGPPHAPGERRDHPHMIDSPPRT